MKTTKNEAMAKIKLAMSMISAANNIINGIMNSVESGDDDDALFDWRNDLFDGQFDTAESAVDGLEEAGYALDEADAPESTIPDFTVEMESNGPVIKASVDDGTFEAWVATADYGTVQTGLMYHCKDSCFDIAVAEVPKGDLAKVNGLPEDNRDIITYMYGNPSEEDWTEKFRLSYDEIKAIAEDEE